MKKYLLFFAALFIAKAGWSQANKKEIPRT